MICPKTWTTMLLVALVSWSGSFARAGEVVIHDDYSTAVKQASQTKRMLLVCFVDKSERSNRFASEVLANPAVQKSLENFVVAKLPVDTEIKNSGNPIRLLSHPAFSYMYGQAGVAVIDYTQKGWVGNGQVVSQFPFRHSQGRSVKEMQTILNLPPGSLTQRTMIYAVRMHPENPQSTSGVHRRQLADATRSHSMHQARINLQGHHQWESRFHQIRSALPGGLVPTEVCAESWPGQNLEDAAIECVRSWRHSSGHWSAVRDHNTYYGYDIKRGSNGVWYGTGIFARGH